LEKECWNRTGLVTLLDLAKYGKAACLLSLTVLICKMGKTNPFHDYFNATGRAEQENRGKITSETTVYFAITYHFYELCQR
jgi:hypothetical protein